MAALDLISFINHVLFIGLFVVVVAHALRNPSRTAFNTALLFGAIAGVFVVARIAEWAGLDGDPGVTSLTLVLLNAVPFAMLRLVDDFSGTPRWVQVAGAAAFVAVSALAIAAFSTMTELVELATIAFFVAVGGYAAIAFARESARTRGITRRRVAAVAVGAGLFICAIVAVLIGALVRDGSGTYTLAAQLLALCAVISFYLGFAPPAWIRRAWREPDLRHFLEQSIHVAGVPDERLALRELQAAAAAAFGAGGASVGIADRDRRILRYLLESGEWVEYPDDQFVAGRAYTAQERLVVVDAPHEDPEHASTYQVAGARTVIAAPITTDDRRIGVLTVYADREPIFIEDDLWLLELLASHTAVLLEARTLTAHASELRGREEAARLKEEFLSAAAHDLRTPLTVVLGQSELLERRIRRDPSAPADAAGVGRIVREARRLRDLVSELLDAQRLEQGGAALELAPADLCDIVEDVRERHGAQGATIGVSRPDRPLVASVDRPRMEQVIENLVENALKYGRDAAMPQIVVDDDGQEVRIAVIDHGVGIPDAERDRIFERFFRASNVQGITDTGLGLGLYICHRVVEHHGGRIWHEPTPGGGSTFVVALPLLAGAEADVPADQPREAGWSPSVASEAIADA